MKLNMADNEENKNYITSYAFGVSDELLGKALARPLRRLMSIFVDLLVVSSLTLMSTTVMAACICVVSTIGSIKARKSDAKSGSKPFASKVLAAAAILSALAFIIGLTFNDIDLNVGSTEVVERSIQSETESEDTVTEQNTVQDLSFVAWVKAALSDLGLGFGWAALYFSVFTAWFNGQTFGKVLFRIRVVKIDGDELSLWESFGRYGGYSAGVATGLLGFLQIYWDPNRQTIHDKISETVVIDLRKPSLNS